MNTNIGVYGIYILENNCQFIRFASLLAWTIVWKISVVPYKITFARAAHVRM